MRRPNLSASFSLALVALVSIACNKTAEPATTPPSNPAPGTKPAADGGIPTASAELQSPSGVVGTLVFRTVETGIEIDGELSGLTPGSHGFHIHETGDCTPPDFTSAGAHFNPTGAPHAAPTADAHHLGDLGNIDADADGRAKLHVESPQLSLDPRSAASIMGKAVVVHAKTDDLKSQPGGDAGDRIACGVIAATEG